MADDDPLAEHLLGEAQPKRRSRAKDTSLELFPDVAETPLSAEASPGPDEKAPSRAEVPSTRSRKQALAAAGPAVEAEEEIEDAGEPIPEGAEGDDPVAGDPVAFARRVAAGLADLVILFLVGAVELTAGYVLLDLKFPPPALLGVGAFLLLVALVLLVLTPFVWGTTPGMALAELRIVAADSGSPTLSASFLRFLGFFLTGALVGVPLLFAAFDRRGRTLADILSKTTLASAARNRPADAA